MGRDEALGGRRRARVRQHSTRFRYCAAKRARRCRQGTTKSGGGAAQCSGQRASQKLQVEPVGVTRIQAETAAGVIGPPLRPVPLDTLVTVPPKLGAVLVSVMVLPKATVPPPDNPAPAVIVTEGLASMVLVTPRGNTDSAGPVIGPPVRPAPVATLVTVPLPVPGKVWPEAKLTSPVLAMENPVSAGAVPFDPNSRFKEPEETMCRSPSALPAIGSLASRPLRSCCCMRMPAINGFEMKPLEAVAVPVSGNNAPAADMMPLNVPVDPDKAPLKAAEVPLSAPVSVPPASCK